ncbi:unnamed protein product [Strongylus vulgaris]|uniref:SCP domain-containing protein n=1 Tax=Strongylus vulgaris TaxID=40348 RepID=A0A3P7JB13_STRVU|nr:unnamed protein product [Strongylus vulgaris]
MLTAVGLEILLLCLLKLTQSQKANCPGKSLTNDERDKLTDWHNAHRSNLAKGAFPGYSGNLNAGKNIYKLKYDCSLEDKAVASTAGVCRTAAMHDAQNVQA